MIIDRRIHVAHLLLFLRQSRSLIACSLRKMYFQVQIVVKIFKSYQITATKYAAYMAWILLCKNCNFREKSATIAAI